MLRWSTDAERDQLMCGVEYDRRRRRGRRRARRRGRGGAAEQHAAEPSVAMEDPRCADPAAVRRRTTVARGARGGGSDEAARPTPEGTLAAALKQAPTVGYLWSSEVAGYALRYAGKVDRAGRRASASS